MRPPPDSFPLIQAALQEGRLPCAAAFAVGRQTGVAPKEVAQIAEQNGIRIGRCQLGLFERKKPAEPIAVSPELRQAIDAALEEDGLPCARAWGVAKRLNLDRLTVGRAADALGVRIIRCQLGCF